MIKTDLSALPEFLIGQAENKEAMTGCTAIIAPNGAVCGVDVRGGSPGTRDTDALDPRCNRKEVHGIMLTGGSAFGLESSCGLADFLEEKGIGRPVGLTVIPNVCAAVLFDLRCGDSKVRPDKAMGREAAENAFKGIPFKSGNYGAGTGAVIGKPYGFPHAMKGGIGQAVLQQGDLIVGAIFAVNCVADVAVDGKIIAGARNKDNTGFADSEKWILEHYASAGDFFIPRTASSNTVIGCVMTNAVLHKNEAGRIAARGQDGIARVIRPSHSIYDGDAVFALASGKVTATLDAIGIMAEHAVMEAIVDAVKSAETYDYIIAWKDLPF